MSNWATWSIFTSSN